MNNNGQVSNCGATTKHQKVVFILFYHCHLVGSSPSNKLVVFKESYLWVTILYCVTHCVQSQRQTTQHMSSVSTSSSMEPDSSSSSEGPPGLESSEPDSNSSSEGPPGLESSEPDSSSIPEGMPGLESSEPDSSSSSEGPPGLESSTDRNQFPLSTHEETRQHTSHADRISQIKNRYSIIENGRLESSEPDSSSIPLSELYPEPAQEQSGWLGDDDDEELPELGPDALAHISFHSVGHTHTRLSCWFR
jgi:hypothetical protein